MQILTLNQYRYVAGPMKTMVTEGVIFAQSMSEAIFVARHATRDIPERSLYVMDQGPWHHALPPEAAHAVCLQRSLYMMALVAGGGKTGPVAN